MDQDFSIYANVDYQVSANVDADELYTLQPHGPGPAPSTHEATTRDVKKSYFRAVAAFLGFLVLLLLTLLITQLVLANNRGSECNMELGLLQTSNNMLTTERDQLQTSNNMLTTERDQLQTSCNFLRQERDQLQKRVEDSVVFLQTLPQEKTGWHYINNSIYYVSSENKTWQQSRDDCLGRGADLVVINSREEQEFLKGFQKRVWIGLSDNETEGTWKWVDGTPLNTSYWASGAPNKSPHGENCVEITPWLNWNDLPCENKRFWICEKRLCPNP